MKQVLTLVAPREHTALGQPHLNAAGNTIRNAGGHPSDDVRWLAPGWACDIEIDGLSKTALDRALGAADWLDGIDWAVQSPYGRRKKVLVADMDSTMIRIETLDTLAAELGFGDRVAEITDRSMRGELDFLESLRERVALLRGQPAQTSMDAVMAQVEHTPGAEQAVKTMAANGCRCALVSGGFTFTTSVVHAELGFHEHAANTLEIGSDGCFTGGLTGELVGRSTKLDILSRLCAEVGCGLDGAAAIGDGANDLDMLTAAGLGVGFHPKPIVRAEAPFRIDHTDMTTLIFFQGYGVEDFAV